MKKRIVSICVIVLVLVLALFVLSACNDGRTVAGTELVSNGGFESYESASGGVTLETIRELALASRVRPSDFISVGRITHSAPSADFSMKMERGGI